MRGYSYATSLVTTDMHIVNDVIDAFPNYKLSFRNNGNSEIGSLDKSGNMVILGGYKGKKIQLGENGPSNSSLINSYIGVNSLTGIWAGLRTEWFDGDNSSNRVVGSLGQFGGT